MAIIRLSAAERKRISIFFTCLLLAVTAWMFYSLSLKYDYQLKTLVTFKNLPQNKAFYPLQSDTVMLNVQGTGWQLLFNRIGVGSKEIKVDLASLEKQHFITFTEQLPTINRQFSSLQKIVSIQPDTLFFDFTTRKVKRIPVKFVSDIKYKKQFGQSKDTKLKPAYITITGPQDQLQRITYWETDTFKKKNVDASLSAKVYLKEPSEPNISLFPLSVEMQLPVEEFTEKVITIPVRVINNPDYQQVKIIPEKVTLTVMVALSYYADINEDDFTVTADLSLWRKSGASKLPVVVKNKNAYVKISQIVPQQVDFMILK
ncbi:CdaR family protein [Pedobacter puniceum]|jgi:YbbR domain-containing protein|uniref:YbbR-like domain-containing protein n=1 Tax=Pedobacter puniceum TaxID=2666136 RepID=A0A7K0FJU9_9SPHI|nr:YbbR-like domain-containing protein [Pedobacter puniceum]MRX46072.1 YbbR-like domain-containing protein [Pedobacter puniceum]